MLWTSDTVLGCLDWEELFVTIRQVRCDSIWFSRPLCARVTVEPNGIRGSFVVLSAWASAPGEFVSVDSTGFSATDTSFLVGVESKAEPFKIDPSPPSIEVFVICLL